MILRRRAMGAVADPCVGVLPVTVNPKQRTRQARRALKTEKVTYAVSR
jgi:hypothetical protein